MSQTHKPNIAVPNQQTGTHWPSFCSPICQGFLLTSSSVDLFYWNTLNPDLCIATYIASRSTQMPPPQGSWQRPASWPGWQLQERAHCRNPPGRLPATRAQRLCTRYMSTQSLHCSINDLLREVLPDKAMLPIHSLSHQPYLSSS